MPSVHFTTTADGADRLDSETQSLVQSCREALRDRGGRFVDASDPATADFILFIEPPRHKFASYGDILRRNPLIQAFAERCFAYDWADGPAGFLPGVYPSVRRDQWDPMRMVPGGFLLSYNEVVETAATNDTGVERVPRHLLSFRGTPSHRVRLDLMNCSSLANDPDVDLSVSKEWFTHSADQKRDHVRRILSAKFALCPRGEGPATFRVYEAMALGRAPVIVSDDWIGPLGPDWPSFALVIGEARIHDLACIVREHEHDWAQRGLAARSAWEQFFAYPRSITKMLEAVERISISRPRGESFDELAARWSSRQFKRDNDWAARQRLRRVMSSPEVRARLRARVWPGASRGPANGDS